MNHNRIHVYLLVAAVVAPVLVAKVPFAGILPFGLLIGCAAMMFFMMKAMGGEEVHPRRGAERDSTAMADKSTDGEPGDHRVG